MIAVYGPVVLRGGIVGSMPMQDLSRELSLDVEVQDQSGGKPATLIKGAGLERVQFGVTLSRYMGVTPELVIGQLRQILTAGVPYALVMGGAPVGEHKWLLTSLSVSDVTLNGRGEMISATVKLTLDEYVREGSKAATGLSGAAGIAGISVTDAYKVQTPAAEDKALLKRGIGGER